MAARNARRLRFAFCMISSHSPAQAADVRAEISAETFRHVKQN
jgi:hypothetical protein